MLKTNKNIQIITVNTLPLGNQSTKMRLTEFHNFFLTCFAVLLLFCRVVSAQSVGLVLSGGGAKGLAHIGMIKALEENNIPIDYIAGTSMGAIVGGLYAIGYSPDEIAVLLKSDDFLRWSMGIIDIEETYYYKSKNESPSWIEFPFSSVNGEFKPFLPTNLISPEQMDLRFMQFFEPAGAGANYDFNQLMVPFFCISSDVHKNQPIVLTKGNLSASIRASMTFPGYFKPISIDSVMLFDGGMLNNFPADLMVEKYHPEILIGSKVVSNPKKPDSEDIYRQLENVFMKTTNYQMPKNGILIEPKVDAFGLFELTKFDTLYQLGYLAALEKMDSLKELIKRRISPLELSRKREAFKKGSKQIVIENIYITGVDNQTADYILKNIQRNRQYLTFAEFEKEYFKLLSDKIIRSIFPRVQYNKATGYFDLYLDIKTKNEFSVAIGGNISSNLRNTGYLDLNYYFQKKNVYNLYSNLYFGNFYNSTMGKFR
ncbi:MAG: patatin-like phospholipase family protein, partial [Salinivirgaceae bacterium]